MQEMNVLIIIDDNNSDFTLTMSDKYGNRTIESFDLFDDLLLSVTEFKNAVQASGLFKLNNGLQ